MKTILIIIAVFLGLALFAFAAPAVIAGLCAWFCFYLGLRALGVLSIIVGLIVQFVWIVTFFDGESRSGSSYGNDYSDYYDNSDYDASGDAGDDANMSLALGAFLIGKSIGGKDD